MKASIIICTCNRAASLHETLQSLDNLEIPPDLTSEVIVVDNASTDSTSEIVQSFTLNSMPLRLVQEPNPGQSRARNTGLAAAVGNIILFTDDDLRLPVDWLEHMCHPILSGQGEAVAGGVTLAPGLIRSWMESVHRYWLAETGPCAPSEQICMVGANMAFSRSVLSKVPCFDPELGPGALGFSDDTLFSKQLWAAGHRVIYAEETQVEHHFQPDRLTRASFLNSAYKHGASKAYVAYHWEHRTVLAPAAQMARKWLQVALWHRRHPQQSAEAEGLPTSLMYNLEAYHFYRHYLIERRRPRLYAKHGLVKIL